MRTRLPLLVPVVFALAATACATTGDTVADTPVRPTSNPVTGAAAASAAGAKAIGAYGAIGTSDDVRGRTSSAGASPLTGRASMAGNDSGTSQDATDDDPPPPR